MLLVRRMKKGFPRCFILQFAVIFGPDVDASATRSSNERLVEDPRGTRCTQLGGIRGARARLCTTVLGGMYEPIVKNKRLYLARAFP